MFIRLNDENKTVINTFNIEYIQKIINNLDDSYIKIGTSICKDDLILIYRNKEKLFDSNLFACCISIKYIFWYSKFCKLYWKL